MVEMHNQVTNIGGFSFTERFVLGIGATNEEEGVILAKAQDGRKVALKILNANPGDPKYEEFHKCMRTEINALKALNHQHVMEIVGAGLDEQWTENGQQMRGDFIATLLECNGELYEFVDSTRGGFEEPISRQLFSQMLSGVTYMHQQGIVNRDFKL